VQQRAVLREIKRVREELEDLSDYLLLLEARVRDEGKPTYSLQQVKDRLGLA